MAKRTIHFQIDEEYFEFLEEAAKKEARKGPNDFLRAKIIQEVDQEKRLTKLKQEDEQDDKR